MGVGSAKGAHQAGEKEEEGTQEGGIDQVEEGGPDEKEGPEAHLPPLADEKLHPPGAQVPEGIGVPLLG